MIINEKYLQDIDDEDEDVAVSSELANNPNRYDFEIILEYEKEVSLWGSTPSGHIDKPRDFSTDDFLDYKDRLEIILDSFYTVQDYSISM